MAKTDTIHIRVNEGTKNNAEQTLAMLGLTISDAVNMLLCQINFTGSLPFQVQLPSPQNVIVNSRADIERKLNEAKQDIADGNVSAADEAFSRLREIKEELISVDYIEFNEKYNKRDESARRKMRELVDSDANTVTKVFSTLF